MLTGLIGILSIIAGLASIAATAFAIRFFSERNQLSYIKEQLQALEQENDVLQQDIQLAITERAKSLAEANHANITAEQLREERNQAMAEQNKLREEKNRAEQRESLALQEVAHMQERLHDWEKTKEESLNIAKTAMFDTGSTIFRTEAEKMQTKTHEQVQHVMQLLSSLKANLHKTEQKTDTIWHSLSTPSGVGALSEIGLEGNLNAYGLSLGRDYIMQFSTEATEEGKRLRPDAVVFLPGEFVMVIDSKASKFFLDIASSQNEQATENLLQQLKKTMELHLKSLSSKSYKDAIRDQIKRSGKYEKPEQLQILTVMYLHSEAAIEKVLSVWPSFRHDAESEYGIIITGPTGLSGLLALSRLEMNRMKQEQHYHHIIDELSQVIGAIATSISYTEKVGKSIESAAKHYDTLTRSMNRTLLPKLRKIEKMGVALPTNKTLPQALPTFSVHIDKAPFIEGLIEADSEETDDTNMAEGSGEIFSIQE